MHSPRPSPSPETVSQAGAGALLAAVGVVEVWLTVAAAGWLYRSGACLVAAVGVLVLIRAVAPEARRLFAGVPSLRPAPRTNAAERILLAE